jgi:hypothetical protein
VTRDLTPRAWSRVSFRHVEVDQAQRLWQPETLYLNTASYGLPPAPAWEELQSVLGDWRGGRTSWEGWGEYTERGRASFARMVNVPVDRVAIGANTSSMVGLAAAALPDGARVVSSEPSSRRCCGPSSPRVAASRSSASRCPTSRGRSTSAPTSSR